jgi:hypothetical protein
LASSEDGFSTRQTVASSSISKQRRFDEQAELQAAWELS